ncbi:MAG: glycoside hydrolase family 18 protein [Eubacterium sp.]
MFKKILIAVLAIAVVAASIFGVSAYSFSNSLKPEITEKELSKDALISGNAKGLRGSMPFSCWKVNEGDSAEIDFGKEVTFNTVTLKESGDNIRTFRLYRLNGESWEMFYEQDRIDGYRMCTFEEITTSKLKIEITQCDNTVKLSGLGIYNQEKNEREIKVSQYLTFGENEIVELRNNKDQGFSGYYDVVTDVIIIGSVEMDEDANISFPGGEEAFADNLEALRDIIGDRDVRIWSTVRFDRPESESQSSLDATKDFINNNIDGIVNSISNFVEKYNLYGIDYDWEYPQKRAQWKAYNLMITESAEKFKVSVALPPWGIHLSKSAVKCIEHVNVMAYDLFDDRGDHANIQWGTIDSAKNLLMAGFEKEQILLGIPTYGRTVDGTAYSWPVARGNEETLGKFNSIVKNNEFTDDEGNKQVYDAYIESYAEARDKTAYAQEAGFGGVMIFRAKCDSPYTYEYSIHRAVKFAIDN